MIIKKDDLQMQWIRFSENTPGHLSLIKEFGEMIESKFGTFDEYCMNREKIGKLSFRKKDGTYHGVREQSDDGSYTPVRLPYKFLEEESMWQAWQRMKEKSKDKAKNETVQSKADLPF